MNKETVIELYKDVPFDPSGKNTVLWVSDPTKVEVDKAKAKALQKAFFDSKAKKTFTRQSYTRIDNGTVRLDANREDIADYTYMRINNGGKSIYAFVDSTSYINDNTTELHYTVDVMQTYQFDMELNKCIVEREHTTTDGLFEHIEDEGISAESVQDSTDIIDIGDWKDKVLIMATTAILDKKTHSAVEAYSTYNKDKKAFSGMTYKMYEFKDVDTVADKVISSEMSISRDADFDAIDKDLLATIVALTKENKADAIKTIFVVPRFVAGVEKTYKGRILPEIWTKKQIKSRQIRAGDKLDGYAPRNAKMYTFPFSYVRAVDTVTGASTDIKYELFQDKKEMLFEILTKLDFSPEIVLMPCGYKRGRATQATVAANYETAVKSNGFPVLSWNTDYFNAMMAKAGGEGIYYAQQIEGAFSGAVATVTGGNTRGLTSLVGNNWAARSQPSINHGNHTNTAIAKAGDARITVARYSVRAEDAERIDNYFTRYGYKSGKLKKPNTHARSSFTYVKTAGAEVEGNIQADHKRQIESIFDNGVTFWSSSHINDIGNYTARNDCLG